MQVAVATPRPGQHVVIADPISEPMVALILLIIICIFIGLIFCFQGYSLEEPFLFMWGFMIGSSLGHELRPTFGESWDFNIPEMGIHFYFPSLVLGLIFGCLMIYLRYAVKSAAAGLTGLFVMHCILKSTGFFIVNKTVTHFSELTILFLVFLVCAEYGGKYVSYGLCILTAISGSFLITYGINLIVSFYRAPLVQANLMDAVDLAFKFQLTTVMVPRDVNIFFGIWGVLAVLGALTQIKEISDDYDYHNRQQYNAID